MAGDVSPVAMFVLDTEKSARGAARRRARIISGASLPGMTIRSSSSSS